MPETKVIRICGPDDFKYLEDAARAIRNGGLAAFPTETVYGVGCRCGDDEAYAKLVKLKGRPQEKPFTVHLSGREGMDAFGPEISAGAARLIAACMPGPLTVVLYCRKTGGTVGFRVPEHDVARELIARCGGAVYATSANMSGSASPTAAGDVLAAFGDSGQLDFVVDAGPAGFGRDSTVVDLSGGGCRILRQGAVPESDVRACWAGQRQ